MNLLYILLLIKKIFKYKRCSRYLFKLNDQFVQNYSTHIEYESFIDTFIEHYYLSKNLPNNNLTSQTKEKFKEKHI